MSPIYTLHGANNACKGVLYWFSLAWKGKKEKIFMEDWFCPPCEKPFCDVKFFTCKCSFCITKKVFVFVAVVGHDGCGQIKRLLYLVTF